MKTINRWLVIAFALAVVLLSACAPIVQKTEKIAPSKVEAIDGSKLKRVILTQKAADRLAIQTVSVSGATIPYAAVIYDTEGNTWMYTNPEPLVYVRQSILIDRIDGDKAILSQGLSSNMNVVTVGVSELYGTETGVSK